MQHIEVVRGGLKLKQVESKEGNNESTEVLHFLYSETTRQMAVYLLCQVCMI